MNTRNSLRLAWTSTESAFIEFLPKTAYVYTWYIKPVFSHFSLKLNLICIWIRFYIFICHNANSNKIWWWVAFNEIRFKSYPGHLEDHLKMLWKLLLYCMQKNRWSSNISKNYQMRSILNPIDFKIRKSTFQINHFKYIN